MKDIVENLSTVFRRLLLGTETEGVGPEPGDEVMLFSAFAADAAGEGIDYILDYSAAVRMIVRLD